MSENQEAAAVVTDLESTFAKLAFPLKVLENMGKGPFEANMDSRDFMSFNISRYSVSSEDFRVRVRAADLSPHRYLLRYADRGETLFSSGGHSVNCAPETFVILEPSRSFEARHSGVRSMSISLPGELLRAQVREIDTFCFRSISADTGTGQILKGLLWHIWKQRDKLSSNDCDNVSASIVPLLRSLFGQALSRGEAAGGAPNFRESQVKRVIRAHLPHSGLNADLIADEMGISKRYLCAIMATQGTTVVKAIIESRLERCREDLIDPTMSERSVIDIALGWGFKSPSHFSRCFSQRFGMTPTSFRHSHSRIRMN